MKRTADDFLRDVVERAQHAAEHISGTSGLAGADQRIKSVQYSLLKSGPSTIPTGVTTRLRRTAEILAICQPIKKPAFRRVGSGG